MSQAYIAYHSAAGYAMLSLKESIGDQRAVIGSTGKQVDFFRMKAEEFDKGYIKCANRHDVLTDPKVAASRLLGMGQSITKSALNHIEGVLGMDTRGKSTEQIHAEVVRLSGDLPKGHALRDVPKFADRGQAIAAYTAMRQAIFNLTKENDMTTKTTTKKGAAKAEPKKDAAKAEPKKDAAKAEPKKDAAPVKAKKPEVDPAVKDAAKKARANGKHDLTGPFKLTELALKAKAPEGLRLHEGSSRYALMDYCFKNATKKSKGFSFDDIKGVIGDQAKQALTGMVKYGFLETVKA